MDGKLPILTNPTLYLALPLGGDATGISPRAWRQ